jgi:hypothetical protein
MASIKHWIVQGQLPLETICLGQTVQPKGSQSESSGCGNEDLVNVGGKCLIEEGDVMIR